MRGAAVPCAADVLCVQSSMPLSTSLWRDPCFTPVESLESIGMAEAFVKTFKRDYVRVNPIPGAASALVTREEWMVDYNEVHLHSRLGYRSPQSQC
jgi:putative transposase